MVDICSCVMLCYAVHKLQYIVWQLYCDVVVLCCAVLPILGSLTECKSFKLFVD